MSKYFNKTSFVSPTPHGSFALGLGVVGSEGMGAVPPGPSAPIPALWQNPLVSTSDGIYVEGHKYISFYFHITDDDSPSGGTNPDKLIVVPEVSEHGPGVGPAGDDDWIPMQVEEVALGVATQHNYIIEKSGLAAVYGAGGFTHDLVLAVSIPIRGFRWVRINIKTDVGGLSGYARYHLSGGSI
jgi:hypothetical protein